MGENKPKRTGAFSESFLTKLEIGPKIEYGLYYVFESCEVIYSDDLTRI